jgi:hypothetical protein
MLTSGKFVTGCFGFGVLAFMGTALLQLPVSEHASVAQASPTVDSTLAQADAVGRQASEAIKPRLATLANATAAFVGKNETTARLQFAGMANSLSAHTSLAAWLPGLVSDMIGTDAQVAAQAAGDHAINLAGQIPAVKSVKTDISHLAAIHPALSAPGF